MPEQLGSFDGCSQVGLVTSLNALLESPQRPIDQAAEHIALFAGPAQPLDGIGAYEVQLPVPVSLAYQEGGVDQVGDARATCPGRLRYEAFSPASGTVLGAL